MRYPYHLNWATPTLPTLYSGHTYNIIIDIWHAFQVSAIEQTAFHFSMDSNLLHKESDEAQRQIARQEGGGASSGEESGAEEGEVEEEEKQVDEESDPTKKKAGGGEKRLRNQFNFSERASQTLNNPFRVSSRNHPLC